MTLDDFCDAHPNLFAVEAFRKAYRKGMAENPPCFPSEGSKGHWANEHGLFIDVGGDADDPLPDPT